jgi:hypothetical protein
MTRSIILGLILLGLCLAQQSQPKCNDIVGAWKWFVGPQLTISADHSFTNGENSGNWEMTNAAERKYTLRWDVGGFVDEVILSTDGKITRRTKFQAKELASCSNK